MSLGLELLSAQVRCPTLPPAMNTHLGHPVCSVGLQASGRVLAASPRQLNPCRCALRGYAVTEVTRSWSPQEGSRDSGFNWWHFRFLIPAVDKICQKGMEDQPALGAVRSSSGGRDARPLLERPGRGTYGASAASGAGGPSLSCVGPSRQLCPPGDRRSPRKWKIRQPTRERPRNRRENLGSEETGSLRYRKQMER